MIDRVLAGAVRRGGLVLFVLVVFISAGVYALTQVKLDALPDVTGNQVVVLTQAPGFLPREIEERVTRPVELATASVPGLITSRSISRYGLASVTLIFDDGVPILEARQLVTERLASIRESLPDGVMAPELGPITGGLGEIYHFALRSRTHSAAELLELLNYRIAPILRGLPDVVEVNAWGGALRTIDIRVDASALSSKGMTLSQFRTALSASIGTAAGAALTEGATTSLLRARNTPLTANDVGQITLSVSEPSGEAGRSAFRVADVAQVVEGNMPRVGAATLNGQGETVYGMVQMLTGANALQVMSGIHEAEARVRAALPAGAELVVMYDRSVLVLATLKTVGKSLLEGFLLVTLVLLLALGSVPAALLVAAVIPLSMLGGAMCMALFGVPGNLMSLGALDFGLLVDSAIVLIERLFHANEDGAHDASVGADAHPTKRFMDQVTLSVQATAKPIAVAVLVIVLVYLPIALLTGVEGKMFRPMALTVVFALVMSLVLSLFGVPAMAAKFLQKAAKKAKTPRFVTWMTARYERLLDKVILFPKFAVGAAALVFVLAVIVLLGRGTSFLPTLDEGDLVIQTTRNPDVSLSAAVESAQELERALMALPEVDAVASRIGSPAVATDLMGIEQGDVFVRLSDPSQWSQARDLDQLIEHVRSRVSTSALGAELSFTQPIQMRFNELVGGATTDVTVTLYGEDLDELERYSTSLAELIDRVQGAEDIRIQTPPSIRAIEVTPRLSALARLGLSAEDVLDATSAREMGLLVDQVFDGPRPISIRVLLTGSGHPDHLGQSLVPTADGPVPLSMIADISRGTDEAAIMHEDGRRRTTVGFNVRNRDLGEVIVDVERQVDAHLDLPGHLWLAYGGQAENLKRSTRSLQIIAPIVLLMIGFILYRLFGSWGWVMLIALNVPFAAMGGVFFLALRDLPISISAAVGFMAVSGIAILNGVVLVSSIDEKLDDQKRTQGPDRRFTDLAFGDLAGVVRAAAISRFRPVMMTATVASLGFVPMMLSRGVGAEIQRPLATVVVGGLLTATLLTLFLLPVMATAWLHFVHRRGTKVALRARVSGDPRKSFSTD